MSKSQTGLVTHAPTPPITRTVRRPAVIIEPRHGWAALNLRELWSYRDLLLILGSRDIKLRYKQTILGVIWVVLQPLLAALIFAAIFGTLAKLPSDGTPYLLFVFCGLIPWNFFSGVLQRAGNSLVTSSNMISKVYFPRLLIPIASAGSVLVDLGVSLAVLGLFMIGYGVLPGWQILALLPFLLMLALAAIGFSFWISALNVKYRDIGYALPFLIQLWMYASPVVYAASLVPDRWQWLYALNPLVGLIEGFRWAVLGHGTLTGPMLIAAASVSLLALGSGLVFFRRAEQAFADVV
jgi:lipopolysaccharide transport system permease protein